MDSASTTIADAQREMRYAYNGGALGMLTSAAVWLTAAVVANSNTSERAIWTLFIGGALIHPISVLLTKLVGRPAKHSPGNPFGSLALATTFWMILCLPMVYAASRLRMEWFFPAMLFVIGGRYLTFATMFGARIYWVCGAALILAGYLLGRAYAPPGLAAAIGGGIEATFGIAIFLAARREPASG